MAFQGLNFSGLWLVQAYSWCSTLLRGSEKICILKGVGLGSSHLKLLLGGSPLKKQKSTHFFCGELLRLLKQKRGQHSELQMNVFLTFVMLDENLSRPKSFSPATEFVHLSPCPQLWIFEYQIEEGSELFCIAWLYFLCFAVSSSLMKFAWKQCCGLGDVLESQESGAISPCDCYFLFCFY